jgi:hypothetical protein
VSATWQRPAWLDLIAIVLLVGVVALVYPLVFA